MDKVLIINFRRNGDIFSMAHVIHSFKNKYPHSKINLLIFQEFIDSARTLKYIDNIFTIDRKKIVLLKKNKIFPLSTALNFFENSIREIHNENWDHIINFSNEKLSCLLVPFFKYKKFTGIRYDSNKTILNSNNWSQYLNDIHTTYSYPSFHLNEIFHQMLGLDVIEEDIKIKIQEKSNEKVLQWIEKIRKSTSVTKNNRKKIIGIQFKTSTKSKDIPFELLLNITDSMINNPHFYPVFLTSSSTEEKKIISNLNNHFHHDLISIEADFQSLPSVLLNIDLLLTPDTSVKHTADLTSTPILEISSSFVPFYKQGTIGEGNFVLSLENNLSNTDKGKDIINILYFIFKLSTLSKLDISPQNSLYEVKKIHNHIYYHHILGPKEIKQSLGIFISKYYIYNLFNHEKKFSLIQYINKNFSRDDIINFLDQEKNIITIIVRHLLNTIKSLKKVKNHTNNQHTEEFIIKISELLKPLNYPSLIEIPILIFKSNLETLDTLNMAQNIKKLEVLLFKLKSDIHKLTSCLTELTLPQKPTSQEKEVQSLEINLNHS